MRTNILSTLEVLPYFTFEAVEQLLDGERIAPGSIQTLLYRWMKNNLIYQLKKGVYTTRRFVELHRADADFAPAISSLLIPQSYVSLEYVLQRQGVLSEVTYPISAVTLKHTRVVENKLGTFSYRTIRADLYKGYTLKNYAGIPFAMATAAKALFDYFYFRPAPAELTISDFNLSESLRLNLEDFSKVDIEAFAAFIDESQSQKMNAILKNFRRSVWRP